MFRVWVFRVWVFWGLGVWGLGVWGFGCLGFGCLGFGCLGFGCLGFGCFACHDISEDQRRGPKMAKISGEVKPDILKRAAQKWPKFRVG